MPPLRSTDPGIRRESPIALLLMIVTYIVGGAGIFLDFSEAGDSADLRMLTLLSVGVVGVLSFVRHVVFHRSDAKRMLQGWRGSHQG